MSDRISDERLAETLLHAIHEGIGNAILESNAAPRSISLPQDMSLHISRAVQSLFAESNSELQHSRALVAELRALAERMRNVEHGSFERRGKEIATSTWLASIDSLLSAHGSRVSE
jgi:hypothetical protein